MEIVQQDDQRPLKLAIAGADAVRALYDAFMSDDVCPRCLGRMMEGGECYDCDYDAWEDNCDGR